MRRATLAALALLTLAACQHRHPLSADEVSGFVQSGNAILAIDGDMTDFFGCGSARYHFTNLDDKSAVSVKSEAGAGTGIVPPGRYRLTKVQCAVWGTGGWHIPASGWFAAVSVKPGEVVYLGTLVVLPFSGTPSATLMSPEIQKDWAQVPTYTIRDEMSAAKKVLRPEIGDLVDRMVARPPRLLLSEKTLAEAIQRASQPDANGVVPTVDKIRASVEAEINVLLLAEDSSSSS